MLRLAFLLYSLTGTSLAGAGLIVVLAAGLATVPAILAAAAGGAALGLPAAWLVARALCARGA